MNALRIGHALARRKTVLGISATALLLAFVASDAGARRPGNAPGEAPYVVLGANDLGMHCMQEDFSELVILPPFNTIRATIINRSGEEPRIVRSGVDVSYSMGSNTHAADKTNFWTYAQQLFGVNLPPEVGLTGNRMTGHMVPTGNGDWTATGIPVIPIDDTGRDSPYPLATVTVKTSGGAFRGKTQFVVPVSWEISCNICHTAPGETVATNILKSHDRLHGTDLVNQKPVLCASCHADPALGAPGLPGLASMSSAMHAAHAPRMSAINIDNECYACHPGIRTQCQRDVHAARGVTCHSCHGGMAEVGAPTRMPWVDEPRCGDCHTRPGFQFEQPGKLFKESIGHRGIQCIACHSSPHAVGPTMTALDDLQAVVTQGAPGPIGSAQDSCIVCHRDGPPGPFEHFPDDD